MAEHLNVSGNKELFLYTIPKRNWKEPLEVGLDFTLVSILSVVRAKYQSHVCNGTSLNIKWDNKGARLFVVVRNSVTYVSCQDEKS